MVYDSVLIQVNYIVIYFVLVLPDDKLIFYNNKIYYNSNVQPLLNDNLIFGQTIKTFEINTTTASTLTFSDDIPINPNNIIYLMLAYGWDLNFTIKYDGGSGSVTFNFNHNLFGQYLSSGTNSVQQSYHLIQDITHDGNAIRPLLYTYNNKYIYLNNGSSQDSGSTLTSTNTCTLYLTDNSGSRLQLLTGKWIYAIYYIAKQ